MDRMFFTLAVKLMEETPCNNLRDNHFIVCYCLFIVTGRVAMIGKNRVPRVLLMDAPTCHAMYAKSVIKDR